jgi:hypothetical protein
MTADDRTRAVIGTLGKQPGETLTPERLETIQTAMHEDLGRFVGATSYFVLGSYGEEERPRLEAVRDRLAKEAASAGGDDVDAFLMDEILDISEFFTSKFKLLVSYADHIVGVYEHSQGGHAREAGYIDQPALRQRTRAFYRTDDSQDEQYAAYDGMFARYLLSMERVDRAYTWTTTEELLEAVQRADAEPESWSSSTSYGYQLTAVYPGMGRCRDGTGHPSPPVTATRRWRGIEVAPPSEGCRPSTLDCGR